MVIYNSLVIVFNSVITPKAAAGHDYLLTIADDHDRTMISTPSILYARVGVVLYTYLI